MIVSTWIPVLEELHKLPALKSLSLQSLLETGIGSNGGGLRLKHVKFPTPSEDDKYGKFEEEGEGLKEKLQECIDRYELVDFRYGFED
jgi:hypothetical protein